VRFILCDDARQEIAGKTTLVGVFPGEIIVVHGPRPPEDSKAVAAISSVCLVFFIAGGAGEFTTTLRISAPDDTSILDQTVGNVLLKDGDTATVVGQIRPFLVRAFGVHKATLSMDGREYRFEFTIREAVTPPAVASLS
jgi:hypothetical protein